MLVNEIRERIADKLSSAEEWMTWADILQDTDPGHYGVEDIEVYIESKDVWVDIPEKTFAFKNASLSFSARLGASSDEHGYDDNLTLTVSGKGNFDFSASGSDIVIKGYSVNESLDLYGRD